MTDTAPVKRSFKDSLNLPQTPFAMKANLVQNEPASVKRWAEQGVYDKLRALRQLPGGKGRYVFHDGPPYANGSIHMGHLLNKVMKDFVVRSHFMMGYDCPYTPGWDCHGLPIEHKVMQDLGPAGRTLEAYKIRRKCQESAEKFIKLQKGQMQRLLTLADYDTPYLTMDRAYEAQVLEVFAQMVQQGLVYRALKPVHWSIDNRTALAEAELEYEDREDTSIYVLMTVADPGMLPASLQVPARSAGKGDNDPGLKPSTLLRPGGTASASQTGTASPALMIWTTTPWTLPANLAVAVHPRYDYALFQFSQQGQAHLAILARELGPKVLAAGGASDVVELGTCTGQALIDAGITYRHPFIDRVSPVLGAEYVTLEDGTGLVHTAPGHGVEDYQTGLKNKLPVYCPVKADGTFDDTVPQWLRPPEGGINVWKANDLVVEHLRQSGHLFHAHKFTHSYPHDWRGKTPVIFRATEQWFISVERPTQHGGASLRSLALAAAEKGIAFHPAWGKNRLRGMLETRPDWCISRQRAWGLPIPAFFNPLGDVLLTAASVRAVAQVVEAQGSDAWFKLSAKELLAHYDADHDPDAPAWIKSEIKNPTSEISKGSDIFDVWFDSGCSWKAALERMQGDHVPADLYLEGSDQHRGWFQVSLLCALASTGKPPFKALLTHGFTVDKDGKKMSKSLGNTLEVEALMKELGADVCRWWVCGTNTENDIKVDLDLLRLAGEEYRKVRNTVRFLLSNLGDYDPQAPYAFTDADAASLDAWALGELNHVVKEVTDAYAQLNFPKVHQALFRFCNETLSAVYLFAVKDRLYCDRPDSPRRRRTQTAIHRIADGLLRLLAPVLPHTADEAWQALHHAKKSGAGGQALASVHLATFPPAAAVVTKVDWPKVLAQRAAMLKAIEDARHAQGIDNPLDMGLTWPGDPSLAALDPLDLADLCGISRFAFASPGNPAPGSNTAQVQDLRQEPRCERSWKRDGTVQPRTLPHGDSGVMLSDRDALALGAK